MNSQTSHFTCAHAQPISRRASARALYLSLCLSLFSLTWGCTSPISSKSCDDASDCAEGLVCRASLCVTLPLDMAPPSVECYQSADCGDGARCVEGNCIQNECQDGETRPCMTSCGSGEQLCAGGVWRACNNQPTSEVCGTDEDEDCDGQADEGCGGCRDGDERPCSTSCGEGRERCFGGQYRGCTATRPQQFEFCGDPNQPVDEDCDGEVDEGCDMCEEGERRACSTSCGEGSEVCIESTWRNCDARQPSDELCDNVDNDCDGDVDEDIIRGCDNLCGSGFERCEIGAWVGCDAPENCNCSVEEGVDVQVCEACGQRSRTCDTPLWGEWGECQMSGQCVPGATEDGPCGFCGVKRRYCVADCQWGEWQACRDEGACAAGDEEREACPSGCGERVRICGADCQWGEWSDCAGDNVVCSPGAQEEEVCGACGEVRQRSCNDQCQWDAWGECLTSGCNPGDVEERPCGACQTESRTCSASCEWGEWGACSTAACSPGDTESRSCGNCGEQVRTCTTSCGWSEWSDCNGQGECAPGAEESFECGVSDTGECSFGTQVNSCNDQCRWVEGECRGGVLPTTEVCGSLIDSDCDGDFITNADRYEPNNECNRCYSLMADPNNVTITAQIDNVGDRADFFCFRSSDSLAPLESVSARLNNVPNSADYDLFLYKSIDDCLADNYLDASVNGSGDDEEVSWTEGFGDDTSVYVLEVRSLFNSYSCNEPYSLTISGL